MTGEQLNAAVAELAREGVHVAAREDAGRILVDVLATDYSVQGTRDHLRDILPGPWSLERMPEVVS